MVFNRYFGFTLRAFDKPITQRLLHAHCTFMSALASIMLTGCSQLGVKPYERGLWPKNSMLLTSDPLEAGLDEHIYFSKEASSGGRGFGGGGCGCN